LHKLKFNWRRIAQWVVVLLCAFALKLHYSKATADELRWILAPTTALVEWVSRTAFEFESHAGYLSGDRSFLIAPACAGVNFLIAAFLMLSFRKLLNARSTNVSWLLIPGWLLISYAVTVVANTTRISIALSLRRAPLEISWLSSNELHRFEGILIYFGFLLLLFVLSEGSHSKTESGFLRRLLLPLLVYYGTTLGIPLATGAWLQGRDFWQYSVFVLLIPLLLILAVTALRSLIVRRHSHGLVSQSGAT
jgi:exosortase K